MTRWSCPLTENLNRPTMDLLDAYVKAQGVVLCCDDAPCVDGRPSNVAKPPRAARWKRIEVSELPTTLLRRAETVLPSTRGGDKGNLFAPQTGSRRRRVRLARQHEHRCSLAARSNRQLRALSSGTRTRARYPPILSRRRMRGQDCLLRSHRAAAICCFCPRRLQAPEKQPTRKVNVVEAKGELADCPAWQTTC